MKMQKTNFPKIKSSPTTIDNLYPDFTAQEKAEAQEFWKRYVALVWRIYQRIRREKQEEI
jgi:hypothetical protein